VSTAVIMIAGAISVTALALVLARRRAYNNTTSAIAPTQLQEQPTTTDTSSSSSSAPSQNQVDVDDQLLDSLLDNLLTTGSSTGTSSSSNTLQFVKQFYDVKSEYSRECECEFGFSRPGFKQDSVTGRVAYHDKHLFVLTRKQATEWSEDFGKDGFPAQLKKTLREVNKKDRCLVSVAEAVDGEDASDEDNGLFSVIVMPDMIKYTGVTMDSMAVMCNNLFGGTSDGDLSSSTDIKRETIQGAQIFICCHGSKDMRCGVCGPQLYKAFAEQIPQSGYSQEPVAIRRCNHIGGHKFAGNLIIYKYSAGNRRVFGDWYGYVDLSDVDRLINTHLIANRIVKDIWRGRAGMKNELAEKFLQFQ